MSNAGEDDGSWNENLSSIKRLIGAQAGPARNEALPGRRRALHHLAGVPGPPQSSAPYTNHLGMCSVVLGTFEVQVEPYIWA